MSWQQFKSQYLVRFAPLPAVVAADPFYLLLSA